MVVVVEVVVIGRCDVVVTVDVVVAAPSVELVVEPVVVVVVEVVATMVDVVTVRLVVVTTGPSPEPSSHAQSASAANTATNRQRTSGTIGARSS